MSENINRCVGVSLSPDGAWSLGEIAPADALPVTEFEAEFGLPQGQTLRIDVALSKLGPLELRVANSVYVCTTCGGNLATDDTGELIGRDVRIEFDKSLHSARILYADGSRAPGHCAGWILRKDLNGLILSIKRYKKNSNPDRVGRFERHQDCAFNVLPMEAK